MSKSNSFAGLIFIVIFGIGAGIALALPGGALNGVSVSRAIIAVVIALVVALSIKVVDQWERVVILRLGTFRALKGPGLFFIIPVLDVIPYWIDTRVITRRSKPRRP